MTPVSPKRQRLGPKDRSQIERRVEMREERTAAGRLPLEVVTEPLGIDGKKKEVSLSCEMGRQRAGKLMACGKMDEAVAEIVRPPGEAPLALCLLEGGLGQDFVDGLCHGFKRES